LICQIFDFAFTINKISLFRMLFKRFKLHRITTIFRCEARIFPTHKYAKLHRLATLFNNTNVVSNPEKGDQIVHGVFCQTFTKSCEIHCQITKIAYNRNINANILAKFFH